MSAHRGDRFTDDAGWQVEAGYSRAARRGPYIAVSGTTAHGPDGDALHPGDTEGQTRESLRRAIAAVEALGGAREDIIRSRVLLVPGADWTAAAQAHRDCLGDIAPANSMYVVAALLGTGFLVEVELDAVVAGAS